MQSKARSMLNRRGSSFAFLALAAAGLLTVGGAFSQAPAPSTRRAIHLPDANPQLPFSDGILAGQYACTSQGASVWISQARRRPRSPTKLRIMLDQIKAVLEQGWHDPWTIWSMCKIRVHGPIAFSTNSTASIELTSPLRTCLLREFIGVASLAAWRPFLSCKLLPSAANCDAFFPPSILA